MTIYGQIQLALLLHPPFDTLQMEQNINPVKLISEKDRIRIVNTSFKVKLQALAMELATRASPTHFFLGFSKITVLPNSSK